jgi:hypothetical protein
MDGPPTRTRTTSTVGWPAAGRDARPSRRARCVGGDRAVAGHRLGRLRRGRSGSEMAEQPRRLAVGGWLRWAIPPAGDPGQAEQTTARPASVRTCCQGPLDMAGRAAARSPRGGSTADGMVAAR